MIDAIMPEGYDGGKLAWRRHNEVDLRTDVQFSQHKGLEQDSPLGLEPVSNQGVIRRRTVLGGIISDYYREAA